MPTRSARRAAAASVVVLVAATLAGAAFATQRSVPRSGQYFISHVAGHNEFTGGFFLHGNSSITTVGITTNLIACVRPPSTNVQFPGPPNNWQPQKTIPILHSGANLVFSYSGTFSDRINHYPETMQLRGTITPAGLVSGKVALTEDDTTASTGEIKCHTRGFIPFTGKHA